MFKNFLSLGLTIVLLFLTPLNSCKKEGTTIVYNDDVNVIYSHIKNSGLDINLSKEEIYTQISKSKPMNNTPEVYSELTSECGSDLLEVLDLPEEIVINSRSNELLVIPIVFHIMHDGGLSNISETQVLNALDNLNLAFESGNIQFCLASRDPEGNPHSGINKVNVSETYPQYTQYGTTPGVTSPDCNLSVRDQDIKDLSVWPKTYAYNVWIVNKILSSSCNNTINGYAYIPTNSTLIGDYDGTVIRYDRLGGSPNPPLFSVWQQSGVLVHELGHGFNLYHTYHETNSCGPEINCNTQGDRVCDTPPTINNAINSFCNPTPNTCPNMLYDNFMDNSYGCDLFFTEGQFQRMRNSAQGTVRGPLLQSSACEGVSCVWDLNNDGIVGIDDLLILLSQWGNPYNTNDLLFMLADYGQTCN